MDSHSLIPTLPVPNLFTSRSEVGRENLVSESSAAVTAELAEAQVSEVITGLGGRGCQLPLGACF